MVKTVACQIVGRAVHDTTPGAIASTFESPG